MLICHSVAEILLNLPNLRAGRSLTEAEIEARGLSEPQATRDPAQRQPLRSRPDHLLWWIPRRGQVAAARDLP